MFGRGLLESALYRRRRRGWGSEDPPSFGQRGLAQPADRGGSQAESYFGHEEDVESREMGHEHAAEPMPARYQPPSDEEPEPERPEKPSMGGAVRDPEPVTSQEPSEPREVPVEMVEEEEATTGGETQEEQEGPEEPPEGGPGPESPGAPGGEPAGGGLGMLLLLSALLGGGGMTGAGGQIGGAGPVDPKHAHVNAEDMPWRRGKRLRA